MIRSLPRAAVALDRCGDAGGLRQVGEEISAANQHLLGVIGYGWDPTSVR